IAREGDPRGDGEQQLIAAPDQIDAGPGGLRAQIALEPVDITADLGVRDRGDAGAGEHLRAIVMAADQPAGRRGGWCDGADRGRAAPAALLVAVTAPRGQRDQQDCKGGKTMSQGGGLGHGLAVLASRAGDVSAVIGVRYSWLCGDDEPRLIIWLSS